MVFALSVKAVFSAQALLASFIADFTFSPLPDNFKSVWEYLTPLRPKSSKILIALFSSSFRLLNASAYWFTVPTLSLLNAVTNAESRIGNYDFTTLGVVPGMMEYKGVKIQVLDLPGIVEGASNNKGFGKKVKYFL